MEKKSVKIVLRPIELRDAEILMELNNNYEVSSMLVGTGATVSMDQQLKWMENLSNERNTRRWMIDYEGNAVGTVFISSIDKNNGVGNINIKLLPQFHGRGIAKSAVKDVCNIAFNEMGLDCITAHVLSYNESSQRLFKRTGFHEDGVLRGRVIKNGERWDLVAFSRLKTDLMGIKV